MFFKQLLNHMSKLVNQVIGKPATGARDLHLPEGIGTSGSEVVLICKKKYEAAGGGEGVWFSAIDSSSRLEPEFEEDEMLVMNQFPAHDMLEDWPEHPERYPGIKQHLTDPSKSKRSLGSTDDINEGVQGAPDLGILLLLWYLWREGSTLWSFLLTGVRVLKRFGSTLRNRRDSCLSGNGRDRSQPRPGLTSHQFAFTGGGTGAGTLLLFSYLRQHQLRREYGLRDIRVNVDLLLPGNLTHVDDFLRRAANNLRTIKEIMAHYRTVQPPLEYGALKISRSRPPYSVLTLFDVKTANGAVLTEEQARQICAEVWWQKHASGKVAEYYSSHLSVDVAPHLRYPHVGAVAGAARLTIPLPEIVADFSLGLAEQLVRKYLLRARPAAQARAWAQSQTQAFINQYGLRDISQFFRHDRGRWLGYNLKPYERAPLPGLKLRLANYLDQTVKTWKKTLSRLLEQDLARLNQAQDQWVIKQVNDPEGGIVQVRYSLGIYDQEDSYGLIGFLQQQRHLFNLELTRVTNQLEKQKRLGTGNQGWWARIKQAWQFPRKRLITHYDQTLSLHQDREILTTCQALIEGQLARAKWWVEELADWQSTEEQLAEILKRRRQELTDYRMAQREQAVVVSNVLCLEDQQRLYEQHLAHALRTSQGLVSFAWEDGQLIKRYQMAAIVEQLPTSTNRWAVLSDEGILQFLEFTAAPWLPLIKDALSVESVLKRQGKSADEVYQELLELASPLIAVDMVEQIKPIRKEVILGSEQGSAGFFSQVAAKVKDGLQVIQSGDRFNTTVLVTWWGIDPLAMTNTEASRRAYEYLLAQGEQLNVFVLDEAPGEEDRSTDPSPKTEPAVTDPAAPEEESEEINVVSEK